MTEAEIEAYIAHTQANWARVDALTKEQLIAELCAKDRFEDRESLTEYAQEFKSAGAFYDWIVDFSWYSDAKKDEDGFRPRSYTRQGMHDYMVNKMREGVAYWEPRKAAA